jgi:DNA-binding CsgD family transcriptional regulator/tetratricopeptide (TPR) repeat protein
MTSDVDAVWPLVGRAEELALIEEALRAATPSVVIAGEAGVGKTRLAAEFAAHARAARVVRVAASTSLREVPLGAFGAQLPGAPGRAPRQKADSLRAIAEALAPAGADPPLVWVDDAHLLDDLSAGLVLQLAAGGRASLLATLRSGEPCPDAVRRLWRDGLAQRLELQPLGVHDVGELLGRVLGAPPDGATLQRMGNASRGNLLYLRELVRIGLASGALARRGEVWIWDGPLRVSPGLQDLIAERIGGLDAETRAALEAVAVAEPLTARVAERLGIASRMVDLERHGLLQVEAGDAGTTLRLAHPLFGHVLRAGLSPLRAAELERAHAGALAATGGDSLRLAIAQVAGHMAADPALLLDAALRARVLADHALATKLTRAAVAAGGGGRAIVAHAECLFWEQRYDEALRFLDENPIDESDVESRIIALHNRASALFWGLGRAAEALDALQRAEAIAPENPFAAQAAGQRALVLTNEGRSGEAIELARRILDDPRSRAPEKVYAYSAITVALAQSGRFGEALAHAQAGMPLALQIRDELPATGGGILIGAAIAWFLGGDFAALDGVIGAIYRTAAERGDPFLGVWAHFLARADLARGRLADADRRASEAVALLRLHDPGLLLPWALAVLAQIAAQRGEVARAQELIRELDARPCRIASCDAELEVARAWVEAAVGDRVAARRRAVATAWAQHEAGLHGPAAFAAHEAARLGAVSEAEPLFGALDRRVEGPLCAAWAQEVGALASRDAAALESAAEALAAAGALLDAAEADATASVVHREAGRRLAAQRAAARALKSAASCGGPRTPLLDPLRDDAAAELTPRELHIARLAASGRTRREIATALGLSMRTVSNHLNHIYAKLGVADRASLAAYLEGA